MPWSQPDFERALADKQQLWSRLVNHPAKGPQAKQNLQRIPQIKKAMEDEEERTRQAKAARELLRAGQAEKHRAFREELRLHEAKGYLLESEVTGLIKRYGEILGEAEIRKMIKVEIRAQRDAKRPPTPELDSSLANNIDRLLQIVGKRDLYDFLGAAPKTRREDLVETANAVYRQCQTRLKKTEEVTARKQLSGHCQAVFRSDDQRARYDGTLRQARFEDLKEKLDNIGRVAQQIHEAQVDQLLRDARTQGLDVAEAQAFIREYATSKKWAVVVPAAPAAAKLQKCGVCGELNSPEDQHCTECGEPLKYDCPRCRKGVRSEQNALLTADSPSGIGRWRGIC